MRNGLSRYKRELCTYIPLHLSRMLKNTRCPGTCTLKVLVLSCQNICTLFSLHSFTIHVHVQFHLKFLTRTRLDAWKVRAFQVGLLKVMYWKASTIKLRMRCTRVCFHCSHGGQDTSWHGRLQSHGSSCDSVLGYMMHCSMWSSCMLIRTNFLCLPALVVWWYCCSPGNEHRSFCR